MNGQNPQGAQADQTNQSEMAAQTNQPDQTGQDEKVRRMTSEPVERLIIQLGIPSAIIMMITALYNMADTYFVSYLGTSAVAAVGVAFPLMTVIQAFGFFFGHGTGNYIARELGARRFGNASRMAATGFFSALIAGAILAVSGTVFLTPFVRFLGATDTILPYARDYLRFVLIGAPWMMASLMQNNLLRYQGSSFYGMIGMVAGAVLNVGLDPLFIFVFGLGTAGAGLATIISQFVSFCLLLWGSTRGGNLRFTPRDFAPSPAAYLEMLRGGLPSLIRQGFATVSGISMNHFAGAFGDAAIAAVSIVQRVTQAAASLVGGIGQGFQPVCGFNYGAKRYDRLFRAFRFALICMSVPLAFVGAAGLIFAPAVIGIFRHDDPVVISIGAQNLRYQCLTILLLGWTTLNSMMMQTMGKTFRASFLAIARQGLFMIPLLFILTPRIGLPGIQLAQPLADTATFLLSIPVFISVKRELRG